ncbi:MAG: hypothetical protein ACD_71C00032G0007 [uncultured bacterium (gcode 4)]|uniref:Uncharacterized protein n=1 Tax=uncultured bacterium (gcode 4) TaxID=1234023 RepID=K2A3T1_9BACT|nr:MAG: hypothetical protein ACD_71C00032G0007 [uncultured bacterium (gcode 4)]
MILITRSFSKELTSFDSNTRFELITLISKHDRWLSKNFILLKEDGSLLIYKGYLNGKRVRVVVAKTRKGTYVPLEIFKKESRGGYNIRDDYYSPWPIERMEREIAGDLYETWEVES